MRVEKEALERVILAFRAHWRYTVIEIKFQQGGPMEKEKDVLEQYVRGRHLKLTEQRELILKEFLSTEEHVSIDDLYRRVNAKFPAIGHTTVFRTMKLLTAARLAREVTVDDRTKRYEHSFGHRHHDHLVCTACGRLIEVFDPKIEALQERLCRLRGFLPDNHRLEIFGVCRECRGRPGEKA
jgi:Fur family ferric uptake transcriptional regulator